MPPVPQLPAPQGKDPKAQYDSAIQITGNMRKVQQDADAKAATVREKQGAAEEGAANIDVAAQGAKKNAEKLKKCAEEAGNLASNAASASSSAAVSAAESKKKADQAAKDKSAEKDALQKAAQEDAKHAAAAKDAATKAQAASKQLATSSKNAETQVQNIEKQKQEAKSTVDALKQKESGLAVKLQPYQGVVDKAESQEAECKKKLSAEDAEAVLKKRYEALGGDAELRKALAAEDKEFESIVEKQRTSAKARHKERIKELDDHKKELEGVLKSGEAIQAPMKTWYEREEPLAQKATADANALGEEKLKTEPGKELMHEIKQHTDRIAKFKHSYSFNEKVLEKTKAAMETLKQRSEEVDKQYEAFETFIKGKRTELDNELQIEGMSLEQKVNFLQTRPKPVRDRIQKQLENELNRIAKVSALQTKAEGAEFTPPIESAKPEPINWTPINDRIGKLKSASLDELKKDDPKLAGIQEEYDKAGGDQALLDKRMAAWKQEVEAGEKADKKRGDEYRDHSAKLRERLQDENSRLEKNEAILAAREAEFAEKEARFKELGKKADPMSFFKDFSPQEKTEYQLLDRELKQLKTNLENIRAFVVTLRTAKATSEKLVEQERQRYEQVVDDDRRVLPKPTSEDIHKMPLIAKYTELTGKIPSGGV